MPAAIWVCIIYAVGTAVLVFVIGGAARLGGPRDPRGPRGRY